MDAQKDQMKNPTANWNLGELCQFQKQPIIKWEQGGDDWEWKQGLFSCIPGKKNRILSKEYRRDPCQNWGFVEKQYNSVEKTFHSTINQWKIVSTHIDEWMVLLGGRERLHRHRCSGTIRLAHNLIQRNTVRKVSTLGTDWRIFSALRGPGRGNQKEKDKQGQLNLATCWITQNQKKHTKQKQKAGGVWDLLSFLG